MPVQGITNATGPVIGAQTSSATEMDKLDFMNLLIAQIKNQDPLSPMNNQEFIAQLSQFTSLQEMQEIKGTLEENLALSQSLNNTMLLGLVGKPVTVEGNLATVEAGEVTQNQVQVEAAGTAMVQVKNAAGVVVTSYPVVLKSGFNDISWDGKTAGGAAAEDGVYTLEVEATGAGGDPLSVTSLMTGPVDSIRYLNGMAVVEVAGQSFYVSEIWEVRR
jgi:flagellar basal-body rod modification protein FlgD